MDFLARYFNTEEVRFFVDDEGITWFHGSHVCKVLGYANPRDAIPYNVDPEDRRKIDIGGLNDVWFINKCGLYDLILACKKPVAKPFHKWLSHEVLPSIDEKGGYISPTATNKQLDALQAQIARLQKDKEYAEDRYHEKASVEYQGLMIKISGDLAKCVNVAHAIANQNPNAQQALEHLLLYVENLESELKTKLDNYFSLY